MKDVMGINPKAFALSILLSCAAVILFTISFIWWSGIGWPHYAAWACLGMSGIVRIVSNSPRITRILRRRR